MNSPRLLHLPTRPYRDVPQHPSELARRAARRQKRAAECRATAAVCFVCVAAMMLPSIIAKWPGESLLIALSIGAVAGIMRGAKAGNPEW